MAEHRPREAGLGATREAPIVERGSIRERGIIGVLTASDAFKIPNEASQALDIGRNVRERTPVVEGIQHG
ncbi:hypothetical protein [Bosea sp. TAF32]|uniref:hypothetical protein n=1 Tax=Bosea sp. TAF32 TaxID=3237482 RepID=UPI003F8DBB73